MTQKKAGALLFCFATRPSINCLFLQITCCITTITFFFFLMIPNVTKEIIVINVKIVLINAIEKPIPLQHQKNKNPTNTGYYQQYI